MDWRQGMPRHEIPASYEAELEYKLDPAAIGSDLNEEIEHLLNNPKSADGIDEEEWERICRMAVILYHKLGGNESFGDCFHTAVIWERG